MGVTIKDVAKAAGVSVMTVSRVINKKEYIAQATRDRVLKAIKDLHYKPNIVARSLVAKKTDFIGLIVPDIGNPFFADLVKGAESLARERGYSLILGDTEGKNDNEKAYIDAMRGRMCDGIIMVAPRIEDDLILKLNEVLPLVLVDRYIESDRILQVWIDNADGAFRAVEHLIQLGHRRIGFIAGPQNVQNSFRREEGYRRALTKYGIEINTDLMQVGDFYFDTGSRMFDLFMERIDPPTAIFASNDLMALGVIKRAKERGLSIPGDLSVVGFDDIFLAAMIDPPLTTVRHPTIEMGMEAIEQFIDLLDDRDREYQKSTLENKLIIRKSTAVPKAWRRNEQAWLM